jgi:hypothetical protein
MFTVIKAIPWQGLCIIAVGTMLFYSGWHAQGVRAKAATTKLNDEIGRSHAVIEQQQDQLIWEKKYEAQLQAAANRAVADRLELSRLRAAPHPRLMCHTAAAASGGSPVPGIPLTAGGGPAGSGALPQGPDIDYSERLYAQIADSADNAVEACREALNRWPH